MNRPAVLRRGDVGEAVRDLQQRLRALGHDLAADRAAEFGSATETATRAFQESRGLRVDGVCGGQTWAALVECAFSLGDRLLYSTRPMLRGDDVGDLQQRLNALGFDAGREDAIFGPATERALREFQVNAGLAPDGVCGPSTRADLLRLGSLAAGSVANVREREALRREQRRLHGRRVFVAAEPGLEVLADAVARGLGVAGARVLLDTSGRDDPAVAGDANRYEADVFLALRAGDRPRCRCSYFATRTFRSEAGYWLALRLDEELAHHLGPSDGPGAKTYTLLRETRMAAVVCEPVLRGDVDGMRRVVARTVPLADAIVAGLRRGVEEPIDATA